ncbi:MAG: Uncharacterized protein CEN90_705 [Parcubacteria group bacterium Licking1014_17]|nr:MAG: Uncharacterized protein CEN90_705 [Parcubacteria group bacterium Licking1014_17]
MKVHADKGLVFIFIIGLLSFLAWLGFDNDTYYNFIKPEYAKAATSAGTSTLNVTVAANIALAIVGTCDGAAGTVCDADSTVNLGTLTAGSSNKGNIQVRSTSNDTITLAVGRDRANPTTTLASTADTSVNISDSAGGIDAFAGCISPDATRPWQVASTGLGFGIWKASIDKDTTCWGAGTTVSDALNRYAALQASNGANTAWTTTSVPTAGIAFASVGLQIDVSTTQRATTYTGDVVLTETTTP